MSEYQRYEFMARDRPLTRAELEAVNGLSSHIDASSTHALIEYHWSGFKARGKDAPLLEGIERNRPTPFPFRLSLQRIVPYADHPDRQTETAADP